MYWRVQQVCKPNAKKRNNKDQKMYRFRICVHSLFVGFLGIAANVSVTDVVADLATENFPLPQTKLGKKSEQLTEN